MLSKKNLFVFALSSVLLSAVLVLAACGAPAAPAAAPAQEENVDAPAPPPEEELVEGEELIEGEELVEDEELVDCEELVEGEELIEGEELVEDEELVDCEELVEGEELIDCEELVKDEELIEGEELVEGEELIEGEDEMLGTSGNAPSTPLQVKLYMSQPPVVGEEAEILVEVMMVVDDAPEVTAQVELPPGVELVSGETSWTGSLNAGESAEFSATIVFTEPDEYGISAIALAPINPDVVYGGDDAVFLTVGVDSSHFGLESGSDPQVESGTDP